MIAASPSIFAGCSSSRGAVIIPRSLSGGERGRLVDQLRADLNACQSSGIACQVDADGFDCRWTGSEPTPGTMTQRDQHYMAAARYSEIAEVQNGLLIFSILLRNGTTFVMPPCPDITGRRTDRVVSTISALAANPAY